MWESETTYRVHTRCEDSHWTASLVSRVCPIGTNCPSGTQPQEGFVPLWLSYVPRFDRLRQTCTSSTEILRRVSEGPSYGCQDAGEEPQRPPRFEGCSLRCLWGTFLSVLSRCPPGVPDHRPHRWRQKIRRPWEGRRRAVSVAQEERLSPRVPGPLHELQLCTWTCGLLSSRQGTCVGRINGWTRAVFGRLVRVDP